MSQSALQRIERPIRAAWIQDAAAVDSHIPVEKIKPIATRTSALGSGTIVSDAPVNSISSLVRASNLAV